MSKIKHNHNNATRLELAIITSAHETNNSMRNSLQDGLVVFLQVEYKTKKKKKMNTKQVLKVLTIGGGNHTDI